MGVVGAGLAGGGGDLILTSGDGGSETGGDLDGDAGSAGNITIVAGDGGDAGADYGNAGHGGNIEIASGYGGTGASNEEGAGGNGGIINITIGLLGTGIDSNGINGNLFINNLPSEATDANSMYVCMDTSDNHIFLNETGC